MRYAISFSAVDVLFLSDSAESVPVCLLRMQIAFVSSVKYHFPHIFVTNVFNSNKDIEYLFAKQRKRIFKLDILYSSEKHYKLNRIVV